MIFVTVGTQLPFDRLVRTVDAWSGKTGAEVFAQIGPGEYVPRHLQWTRTLPADECNDRIRNARAVVAHAGMGSILTALQCGKPIVVMPRRAGLGEHRNDHQVMTAKHFQEQGRIRVAFDEAELVRELNELATLKPSVRISATASPALVAALRQFVHKVAADAGGGAAPGLNAGPVAGASVARA
jgi:UDP-N-acetylglucosamine transferase subunit ALG13